MALVATVTGVSAAKTAGGFSITANLLLTEDSVEVLNRDFSQEHNPGNNISIARDALGEQMQNAIDKYKAEQNIFNSAALDTALTQIQNNLEV